MATRVGIPRAMGYYYLYPFFRTLVRELGAEPVVSPRTTTQLLEGMELCPTDEPCLAVKLHFSHADVLARRADIDLLLLPVIARVDRTHCCPKFIGIADMIRHGLRLSDDRVLTPELDYSEDDRALCAALAPMAERLGVADTARLRAAVAAARAAQTACRRLCVDHQLTIPEAYAAMEHGAPPPQAPTPNPEAPTVAVIGHPYILYEPVAQNMVDRLRAYGRVITSEMVDPADCARAIAGVREGSRLWPFEAQVLGAALHLLTQRQVDKLVLVGSFECGPESIIEHFVEDEAQRLGVPCMVLALDEHSGEAGLVTRLEAFMDTDPPAAGHPPAHPTPHVVPRPRMVVGFPSMGYLDHAVRGVVEHFGLVTLPTPRTTRQCIELGREVAPEFVCFPFTATLGQMRHLLDQGANTLIMVGGKGACRLGWYAQVQERLLRGLGYEFQLIEVDSPFPLGEKWGKFREMLRTVSGDASWVEIGRAMYTGYQRLAAMDRADALARRLRAYEVERGAADRLLARQIRALAGAEGLREIAALDRQYAAAVAAVPTAQTDPLRVRVVGEIWVVLEQSATREVEKWLGGRDRPRVWVQRDLSASSWFDSHVLRRGEAHRREERLVHAATPWLAHKVGGHGQISVGEVATARDEGVDGVLHVFPFTCMPEIIAQNIMVRMSETLDVPILTYIVSEQMGEAGMETRLEAFLDLLEERRLAGGVRESGFGVRGMAEA